MCEKVSKPAFVWYRYIICKTQNNYGCEIHCQILFVAKPDRQDDLYFAAYGANRLSQIIDNVAKLF